MRQSIWFIWRKNSISSWFSHSTELLIWCICTNSAAAAVPMLCVFPKRKHDFSRAFTFSSYTHNTGDGERNTFVSTEERMFKHRKLKRKKENTQWAKRKLLAAVGNGRERRKKIIQQKKKEEKRSRADFQFSLEMLFHAAPNQNHWQALLSLSSFFVYHKKLNRQFITVESFAVV